MTRSLTPVMLAVSLSLAFPAAAAPPAAPGNLSASPTAPGQVTLSWSPSAGATGYRVYRNVDDVVAFAYPITFRIVPGTPIVATPTATALVDAGLPPLVRQFYAVTAVNADGESSVSLVVPQVRVLVTAPPDAPIFGMADYHAHQFANLAFGKELVWGKAFDPLDAPGSYNHSLPFCNVVHGAGGVDDFIGAALDGHLGHLVGGSDASWATRFDGWPAFDSHTHQALHYRWLERAFEGGLRLMVMHAVNNELLCRANSPLAPSCADMPTVDEQLQAAKDLEAFIDARAGGPGRGWYRIVRSAAEARHVINDGKLAVVLGIEVDALFGCSQGATCTEAQVQQGLDHYRALGVRHVFPLHVFDNGFGGAALYDDLFDLGNRLLNGTYFSKRECAPEGYHYKAEPPDLLGTALGSLLLIGTPPVTAYEAECSARGLTPLGEALVRGLMARRMIVDVDHMSAHTTDAVLSLAEAADYAGICSGHTGLLVTSSGNKASEGQKTAGQLARIRALSGAVAPILAQGGRATAAHPHGIVAQVGTTVPNDCGGSSKTFAQTYLAAVEAMGGPAVAGVGFGSDFNGLAGEPGPRFGPKGCPGDQSAAAQAGRISYPFPIFAPPGVASAGHLGKSLEPPRRVGGFLGSNATDAPWDYNEDGLAHVGLLPDFVEDLRRAGLSDAQLQPLFRSAEAYLRMWERAEATPSDPPTASHSFAPPPGPSGWNGSTVVLSIAAAPGSAPVDRIEWSAAGAQPSAPASVPGAAASVAVSAEGVTTVTYQAVDAAGNRSALATATVRVDATPPAVACQGADGLWHAGNVSLACTASDPLSGLASAGDARFTLATSVAAGAEEPSARTGSRSVADAVGNTALAGPIAGNMVDRRAPAISIYAPSGGVFRVNETVLASYACTDGGSGVATCSGPVANGAAVGTGSPGRHVFTVRATDRVGNGAHASARYAVTYRICPLHRQGKAKHPGSTVPVKLRLCDASGANLSSPAVTITATALVNGAGAVLGLPRDAGNANPGLIFRYDPSLAGYIFNLKTDRHCAGARALRFTVSGDPLDHDLPIAMDCRGGDGREGRDRDDHGGGDGHGDRDGQGE